MSFQNKSLKICLELVPKSVQRSQRTQEVLNYPFVKFPTCNCEYGLFSNAVSTSDYMTKILGRFVKDKLETTE